MSARRTRPGARIPLTLSAALALLTSGPGLTAQAPPPETVQFGQLAGDWDVVLRSRNETGAWAEEPQSAVWSWRVVLGGHAVQDFWTKTGSAPGSVVYGTNLRIYDPAEGLWRVRWTASDDRGFMELTARQEGELLRVYGTHASGRPLRITFSDVTPQRFRWLLEVGDGEGSWTAWSRMEARRRSGPPSDTPAMTGGEAVDGGSPDDLELLVRVRRSPGDVLRDWLDPGTVDRFLGVSSVIEPRVGGAYEVFFRPGEDAEARANSTLGSRILALEAGRHLAFEWRVPPWAREPARSAPPTRVDVWVEEGDAHPAAAGWTLLRLRHSGLGGGPAWREVGDFFHWSWFEILARYREMTREG